MVLPCQDHTVRYHRLCLRPLLHRDHLRRTSLLIPPSPSACIGCACPKHRNSHTPLCPPHPQAIRAIRHPERYGPRSGDTLPGAFGPQSRARGLTRAILDTFPVVKFGRADAGPEAHAHSPAPAKDIESADHIDRVAMSQAVVGKAALGRDGGGGGEEVAVELREWNVVAARLGDEGSGNGNSGAVASGIVAVPALAHALAASGARNGPVAGAEDEENNSQSRSPSASTSTSPPSSDAPAAVRRPAKARGGGEGGEREKEKDVVPDAIGRETCPICIVDFEEGDDLRVLPCEGHHRFHQECVDQWLLELSSSCPLCRQGTRFLLFCLRLFVEGRDEG